MISGAGAGGLLAALVETAVEESEKGPYPTEFRAATRNTYEVDALSEVAV